MRIAYTYVAIDIFHYGHLQLLQRARSSADRHVCGLLSDAICRDWNGNLVMNYEERLAILKTLACVDEVIEQKGMDPTENLKQLHERFPDAELVLFQGHQDWQGMPGTVFVESIGGRVVKPEYYPRLSRRFIREELNRTHRTSFRDVDSYILGNFQFFTPDGSSKAHTLKALQPLLKKSRIEKIFAFTTAQWDQSGPGILAQVRETFRGPIVVRSSAAVEDSMADSHAGVFHSELDVDSQDATRVSAAVDKVRGSYGGAAVPDRDQILIQPHTQDVAVSGVVFTRNLQSNAPYYVINYDESAATDAVTSGAAGHKIEIARDIISSAVPARWRGLLDAVREIEAHLEGLVLDIEFALQGDGSVVIFQVRPLAANARFDVVPDADILRERDRAKSAYAAWSERERVLGADVALSDMSFWNPAEIIGDRAGNLDYSLYRYLILWRAWNEGLLPLGYRRVDGPLMVRLGNKPYIHVTRAFAALLPADLPDATVRKLLDAYLGKLRRRPELHDKIEFEIVHNAFTPTTDAQLEEVADILLPDELRNFRAAMIRLTEGIFRKADETMRVDRADLEQLGRRREELLARAPAASSVARVLLARDLLDDARRHGTPRFARVARMAFIGNQYLKGLAARGAISGEDVVSFMASIQTVASELDRDVAAVIGGTLDATAFLRRYGHLRPGTYDVTKLPYAKNPHYFSVAPDAARSTRAGDGAAVQPRLEKPVAAFLADFPVKVGADALLRFIADTTRNRESFKFEFTKSLSAALELLADTGEALGFSRQDVACLSVDTLRGVSDETDEADLKDLWAAQIEGRRVRESLFHYLSLPAIVAAPEDLDVIASHVARPNFISDSRVVGELVEADNLTPDRYDAIRDRIVLLEKADPGYDWIFSRAIKGLITKFGGVASHMAIRCAEFRIPAAIGCGDVIYNRLCGKKLVQLDCRNKTIMPIR